MPKTLKRVLIAAGGSGGHIFPAMALGRSLKALGKDIDIMYVGSDKALDRRIFEKGGVRFKTLSSNKLPYKISLELIPVSFKLLFDILKSLSIVFSYKPDVVVGFGGYISFPVVLSAWLLRIPVVAHEQNAVPGRANKLLFKFAARIALSFEETKNAIGPDARKAVFTGNPIRVDMFKADGSYGAKRFGLDRNKFTILVMGGSQGASFLNRTFVDSIFAIDPEERASLQVIHLTGVKDYEWALKAYGESGIDYRVHSFIDSIEEAYYAADLVITRSGASALFELAFLQKAMILVPYPFAMSHQLDNALAFSKRGAAIMIEERGLAVEVFKDNILGLMKDRDRLKKISEAAGRLAVPQASDNLAREVISLGGA